MAFQKVRTRLLKEISRILGLLNLDQCKTFESVLTGKKNMCLRDAGGSMGQNIVWFSPLRFITLQQDV